VDSVLFPVLAIANAVGTWFLASYLMASFGWRRLASAFRVARGPSGPGFGLAYLGVDAMQYSGMGVVRATVGAEGLGLRVLFLFRVGHPPLLLPWSALGPVVVTRSWWRTGYEVSVRVSEQRSVRFRDQRLYEALQLRRG
jgi:hypothetical protein